jgi:hypothetical protein
MEQLKVCTNDLPSVAKKEATVIAALVLSTEAFPTAGLIHHLEVPTTAVTSIPGRKVGGGGECWNSGLDGRLEMVAASIQLEVAVATTSKAA